MIAKQQSYMKDNNSNQDQDHIYLHPYKWNHSTYVCLCNGGKADPEKPKKTMRYRKKQKNGPNASTSSDQSLSCASALLYDTDLSDVSDTDCSCSDCMQANLNAYNDFLKDVQQPPKHLKRSQTEKKLPSTASPKKNNKKQPNKIQKPTKLKKTFDKQQPDTINNSPKSNISQDDCHIDSQYEFNEYVLITRNRARKYMEQRRKLKDNEELQKEELKEKIKHNLQVLKYAAKLNRKVPDYMENNDLPYPHEYKWSHSIYPPNQSRSSKVQCCHFNPKDQLKQKLSTNLQKFHPQFQHHREEFLQQAKQKRLEKLKQKAVLCPYDECQNHHMKTSKDKIKKIQKFIQKKAKQYKKKKKLQKKKKEDEEKIRQAKLRAIDLKCKNIVENSKKYDPTTSRTSFKLSIDNFDTFSELRQAKEAKEHQKKMMKGIKKNPKQLENAIYEDLDENQQFEIENKRSYNKQQQRTKSQYPNKYQADDDDLPNPKIIKDARIYPPKAVKPTDKQNPKANQKQDKPRNLTDLTKQEKKKKQLQDEIIKKKQAILQQYQKRNATTKQPKYQPQAKNKALRQDYQQSLKKDKKNKRNSPEGFDSKAKKTYNEAKADPFIQSTLYHEDLANNKKLKKRESNDEDQIYQANINKLLKKQRINI